jgi:hypothetical protein
MRRRCVLALYAGVGACAGAKRLAAKCFPFGADYTIKLLELSVNAIEEDDGLPIGVTASFIR